MLYCYLFAKTPEEGEQVAQACEEIKARDSAARIDLNKDGRFISAFIYSGQIGGYLSNGFNPCLRLHTIGQENYFEIPLNLLKTLYAI